MIADPHNFEKKIEDDDFHSSVLRELRETASELGWKQVSLDIINDILNGIPEAEIARNRGRSRQYINQRKRNFLRFAIFKDKKLIKEYWASMF